MSIHTFLLDLPDVLESMGFNVEVADGYELGQGHYLWTDPASGVGSYDGKPHGYMVHHSAGSAATPPPHDTSKAGAWIGLKRGTRLYQEGGGTPTIYLATAGPARVSSGFGYKPALWDYTFKQLRAPARAGGSDSDPKVAGNRYTFNMETVHRGDGSPVDPGVLEHVIGLGVALEQMCGLKEMTLGHRSWSQRKIDPYWNDDRDCIIQVQDEVATGGKPMDPNCPWEDQCQEHYFPTTTGLSETGTGKGENQGQCNVPESQQWAADWGFGPDSDKRYKAGNKYRYDYDAVLTEGREMVFEARDAT